MEKGVLFGVIMLFFIMPFISAQPPQFNTENDIGLRVQTNPFSVQQNGQDFIYDAHIFNLTDGVPMTNTTTFCMIHVFDSQGDHLLEVVMPFDINGVDFEFTVEGGNFTDNSLHSVMIDCLTNGSGIIPLGGFLQWEFTTTETGTILSEGQSIVYTGLLLGVLFLFLLSLAGAIFLPFKNNRDELGKIINITITKYFKLGCIFISYALLTWVLNLLVTLSINFSILSQYTGFFTVMFRLLIAFSYPMFSIMFIIILVMTFKDLHTMKFLTRGLNERK